jgi:putative endonuclease
VAHLDQRRGLGADGERVAAEHLQRLGYCILERNLRSRYGELDLIARDGDTIVFVEVRTRRSDAMAPEESITSVKARRLIELGVRYLQDHRLDAADWRIDVIAIDRSGPNAARLNHVISAVEEGT